MFNFFKAAKGKTVKKDAGKKPVKTAAQPSKALADKPNPPTPMLPAREKSQAPTLLGPGVIDAAAPPPPGPPVELPELAPRAMTPERQALIDKALSVHRARQDVFVDLTPEERRRLMYMAMLTLLRRGS